MFITLFVGVLDLSTGEINYSNAGHNPPILISKDEGVEFINTEANLALGVFPNITYKSQSLTIKPGDAIFLYSDGLTEAENSSQELYSEQRLIATLKNMDKSINPQIAIDTIEKSDIDFVQDNEQSDDITMMMITFKSNNHDKVASNKKRYCGD